MAKIYKKIDLNEKDLLEVICSHFKLNKTGATININKYDGDQREPGYVKITVEAPE